MVPAIQLADFKSFTVEKPVAEVTDADVDEAIKRIADQNRPYAAKAEGAKAETGDRVTISFKGSIDGVPFDGGTGEGIQVVIGAGHVHSRLRGAADRHRRRRNPHPEGLVPEELCQREARRPGRPSSRPPRP